MTIDFNPNQHLAIIEAIIEVTDSLGGSSLVGRRLCGGNRFEDIAMVFYENTNRVFLANITDHCMLEPAFETSS